MSSRKWFVLLILFVIGICVASAETKFSLTGYYGGQLWSMSDFNEKVIDNYSDTSGDDVSAVGGAWLSGAEIIFFVDNNWGFGLSAMSDLLGEKVSLDQLSATNKEKYDLAVYSLQACVFYMINNEWFTHFSVGGSLGWTRALMTYDFYDASGKYTTEYDGHALEMRLFVDGAIPIYNNYSLVGRMGYKLANIGQLEDADGNAFRRNDATVDFDFSGLYLVAGFRVTNVF